MRFIWIMFHTALLIWTCLTFVREDGVEHWLQIGMIFFNCIVIGAHLERLYQKRGMIP